LVTLTEAELNISAACAVLLATVSTLVMAPLMLTTFAETERRVTFWIASMRLLMRGLCGLAGERLDLLRHHGKSAAGLTGARGLDRRIECKQIRLSGDFIDRLRHLADFLRHNGQSVTAK
jgi:hypothetical protein